MGLTVEEKTRMIEEEKIRRSMAEKNLLVALILSAIFPGLGDLYCGSWIKAIVFIGLFSFSLLLTFMTFGFGVIILVPVWVFGLISAWLSVNKSGKRAIKKVEKIVTRETNAEPELK